MMKLADYLKTEGAMTARELSAAIGCAPAQIWQWVTAEQSVSVARRPGAAYCSAIQAATGGRVMRWDLRPEDWHRIWPEMVDAPGAPPVPAAEPSGAVAAEGPEPRPIAAEQGS